MGDVRLMTAEELERLPDDGKRYELSRGVLICMSPSGSLSGVVAAKALVRVGTFVDSNGLGVYGTADSGFRLSSDPDTVRAPDVWFVKAERVPAEGVPRSFWRTAPDLAIEVLSPTDRFIDVMRKIRDYLDLGVTLVWVIDPDARSAGVFRAGRAEQFIGEEGILDGEDVLPGFMLRLADVLP